MAADKPDPDYDLIIIGGGVNGAGIARDAALRGLHTCLLEKDDFCSATSRWSSRLIHGGLRYLEHFELGLVYESLHEREHLLKIAPHLVAPLQLMIPIYRGAKRGRWMIGAGMVLYDLLSMRKSLPRHQMLGLTDTVELAPGIRTEDLLGSAVYYDAQVTFAERLVLENILAAKSAGADVFSYSEVDRILSTDRRVQGVRYIDVASGNHKRVTSRVVVNAAGPWVDQVLKRLRRPVRQYIGGTKGTHIIVEQFPGAPDVACYLEAQSDGRPFFLIPWNGLLLIGTTDIRIEGDPSLASVEEREIQYLIGETCRVFPQAQLNPDKVLYTYTGVRPLPRRRTRDEGAITRRHIIKHHRRFARGFYSIIGGKLTTYRHLAEEMVDRIVRRLGINADPCATQTISLPGAMVARDEIVRLLESVAQLSEQSRKHLLDVYGSRCEAVLQIIRKQPGLATAICDHSHAVGAEIVFAFEQEMATNMRDCLQRRCMAGLSADQGRSALPRAIDIAQAHLGWSSERAAREQREYLGSLAAVVTHPAK